MFNCCNTLTALQPLPSPAFSLIFLGPVPFLRSSSVSISPYVARIRHGGQRPDYARSVPMCHPMCHGRLTVLGSTCSPAGDPKTRSFSGMFGADHRVVGGGARRVQSYRTGSVRYDNGSQAGRLSRTSRHAVETPVETPVEPCRGSDRIRPNTRGGPWWPMVAQGSMTS